MAITKYSVRRPTYTAWSDFDDVSNRLARFFDEAWVPAPNGAWSPAVSVEEVGDNLVLTAELPGMNEADISIELEDGVLTISGEKNEVATEENEERRHIVRERRFGAFSRSFTLPRTVDGANISAAFENGVLSVTLPKAPEAKSRKIEIGK
jgi:HSP20 family molecular chaperone IbpA